MISLFILSLYAILIVLYAITCFFIVYHLVNFSIRSEMRLVMIIAFILISTGLLIYNVLTFFSIDWEVLLSNFIN